jgi:hypothetical protein
MYGVAVRVGFWWGKLREGDHLEDLGVDAMIMLESLLRKSVRRTWSGLIGSGWRQVLSCCEYSSEPWGSIKVREFLNHLRN